MQPPGWCVPITDGAGDYQILAVPPGTYTAKVELQGFRTAIRDDIVLSVDARTKMDVPMEIGAMTETIEVRAPCRRSTPPTPALATSSRKPDRGPAARGAQRRRPSESAAGVVYLPHTPERLDPRSGSVSGARADQSNVTLDGVDVNDPQFGTAYTSALRVTPDSRCRSSA